MSNDASENRNHNANKSKALNYLEYTIILKFMNNTNSVANISNVKRGGRDKDENRDETLTTSNYLYFVFFYTYNFRGVRII